MPSRPLWHRAPLQYVKLSTSGGTMEPFCCYLTRNSPAFSIFGENMFAVNAITRQYLNDVKVRSLFLCFAIPRLCFVLEKARCPDQNQRARKDTNHCWLGSRVLTCSSQNFGKVLGHLIQCCPQFCAIILYGQLPKMGKGPQGSVIWPTFPPASWHPPAHPNPLQSADNHRTTFFGALLYEAWGRQGHEAKIWWEELAMARISVASTRVAPSDTFGRIFERAICSEKVALAGSKILRIMNFTSRPIRLIMDSVDIVHYWTILKNVHIVYWTVWTLSEKDMELWLVDIDKATPPNHDIISLQLKNKSINISRRARWFDFSHPGVICSRCASVGPVLLHRIYRFWIWTFYKFQWHKKSVPGLCCFTHSKHTST